MGKKEKHTEDLLELFGNFLETRDRRGLLDYLISNTNLPGRRANLELADAFGDTIVGPYTLDTDVVWDLCKDMSGMEYEEDGTKGSELRVV